MCPLCLASLAATVATATGTTAAVTTLALRVTRGLRRPSKRHVTPPKGTP